MLDIKHILFPIDFSDRCCGAVPFVEAVATRFDAKVTLISVAEPYWYGAGDPGMPVMVGAGELQADVQARLDQVLIKEFAHMKVSRVALIGDPAAVITEYAHNNGIDLIMMPTHGYGPFRSFLLGSVTAKILHDAHCPVWTGAHMEAPPIHDHLACRTVLCAVDGTPKSVPLMKWAAEYARSTGATLRLVHVVPTVESWPDRQFNREYDETLRQEVREVVDRLAKGAGVEAPLCVALGDIPHAVQEEARRHGADMLVIGRGLLHETFGRLRTQAYGIIRQSPCPVISV